MTGQLCLLGACATAPSAPRGDAPPAAAGAAPFAETIVGVRPAEPATPRARRAPEPNERTLRVVLGGDVMFGRYFGSELRASGGDDPFAGVADLFHADDLTLVNLETPLSDVHPPEIVRPTWTPRRPLRFRAPTHKAETLRAAGIEVAVLANNHAEDCALDAIASTTAALDAAGVHHVGANAVHDPHAVLEVTRDGVRVAILAATTRRNRGTPRGEVPVAFMTTDEMLARLPDRVAALRDSGRYDVVIVTLHWGGEFETRPHFKQVRLARALVRAGAHIVHGHHAHVLQPVELYRGGVIVYNTGNLVFDMWQREARDTAVFEVVLQRGPEGAWPARELVVHPLVIDDRTVGPRPAEGVDAERILGPMARRTKARFGLALQRDRQRLVWRDADAPQLASP